MTVCAMFGCQNRMHKGCGKHFFRFPMKDPERLARWIEVVQRDEWKPTVHSKVCSDHFTEKDYMIRPGAACPYLRTDAVPTPVFALRKKKSKKKNTTNSTSDTPESNNAEGEMKVEEVQRKRQDHQVEEAQSKNQDHQVEEAQSKSQDHPVEEAQNKNQEHQMEEVQSKNQDHQMEEAQRKSQGHQMEAAQSKSQGHQMEEAQRKSQGHQMEAAQSKSQDHQMEAAQSKSQGHQMEAAQSKSQGHQMEAAQSKSQDHQMEAAQSKSQGHQMEDMVTQDEAGASKEIQETSQPTAWLEPQSKEMVTNAQENQEQAADMDLTQEKRPEGQTQGGEQSAETQSQEQIEAPGSSMPAEPGKWVMETRGEQPPSDRMAEIDVNITTQSERQVALILAELEDTHCEMRAAEARAAMEAANNDNQSLGESMADCATSSDNQSSNDNLADYIPFDHAYTSLTMSDKENNVPAPTPAPSVTSTPATFPIANPKIVKLRKKIKTIQKQVLRQSVKIKSLKQTLVELRRNNLSERDPERVISEHCSGLTLALFTTQLKNHRKYSSMQYSNVLKDFALSLYQASPKAYKFCRLFLSLPHPVSLRHWKTVSEGNQETPQEEAMQVEAEKGEVSQEDILAGALQAVAFESEASREESLQNDALTGAQAQ